MEVSLNTFEQEVIEASRQLPVLVDFWAPWCGPCRTLGPVLERLEASYAGRFKLVKVNSDENPELSEKFMVRSIPYVLAFVDGNPVDGFIGALPEGQIRPFLERLLPGSSEERRRRGHQLIGAGDFAGAVVAFSAAIEADTDNDEAKLDLADVLLNRLPPPRDAHSLEQADHALASLGPRGQADSRAAALKTRLASLRETAALPDLATLRAQVAADGANLKARSALAHRYIADGAHEKALEELLEIIKRDRQYDGGAARQSFLSVLELAAGSPAVVSEYRKRLSSVLN
ncbi:MAG: tetratricopeptide repeat protein [Steroidobacteraceae bacterium]